MDNYGGGDDMALGIVSRDPAELFESNCSTIIVKREYCSKDDEDFVDVNGPFLCIKKEKDDIDHPILLTNDVDTSQIFEVKPLDPEIGSEQQIGSNGELLVVWQEREPSAERGSERLWVRKDPQCEVWSCKMSATYGHSTGPSRCSQHREAWMVMFGHCAVDGCTKFGVVVSSEDEPVRCEAHAATTEETVLRPKQTSRPLEHLAGLSRVGPSGLGLGLGLGDDSRAHEVSSARSQVLDSGPVIGESSANAQDGQVVAEIGSVPPSGNHPSPPELNGTPHLSVEAEINRLKEEHEGLRQRMVQIEIELARLEGSRNRESQAQEAPAKRAVQQRPRQLATCQETPTSKVSANMNDGKNGSSPSNAPGKVSLDGYNWRKYGEMTVPGHTLPRVFYGCTNIGCIARKIEERTDEGNVRHFYEGVHNHPQPGKSFPRPVSIPHWKRRKRHHTVCTD
ncbi:protein MpWRKY5 [Marchantia polymorpha subsp. ruderalis]